MARGSKSADLFQRGNEADESLSTFTRVSPANVTLNFRKKTFLWACKTNWEGVPRDPIFRGDETQFNFWGLFLAWKRG